MELFCIDESGSINNHLHKDRNFFVISLVRVIDKEKLGRIYKHFVSNNYQRLTELDKPLFRNGKLLKAGNKMFLNGKFHELKGAEFDQGMKRSFVNKFAIPGLFELFFIQLDNDLLSDNFCDNTARGFNYVLKLNFEYLIKNRFLPADQDFILNIDERNEKPDAKSLLEEYLNIELRTGGLTSGRFEVHYFDSSKNKFIQIADVFSNLFYSNLQTKNYEKELNQLKQLGVFKKVFLFPPKSKKEKSVDI